MPAFLDHGGSSLHFGEFRGLPRNFRSVGKLFSYKHEQRKIEYVTEAVDYYGTGEGVGRALDGLAGFSTAASPPLYSTPSAWRQTAQ